MKNYTIIYVKQPFTAETKVDSVNFSERVNFIDTYFVSYFCYLFDRVSPVREFTRDLLGKIAHGHVGESSVRDLIFSLCLIRDFTFLDRLQIRKLQIRVRNAGERSMYRWKRWREKRVGL